MSERKRVVLELSTIEAAHLADLVGQFGDLLDQSAATADPAVARLVPDAYPGDAEASGDFRGVTESDLLERRRVDAAAVVHSLFADGSVPEAASLRNREATAPMIVSLDSDAVAAWLRTLAALRLVLATRLGIRTEDDHDQDDPRFGVYDWLGYRLEGLVDAAQR